MLTAETINYVTNTDGSVTITMTRTEQFGINLNWVYTGALLVLIAFVLGLIFHKESNGGQR
jgi:hypothetical protein